MKILQLITIKKMYRLTATDCNTIHFPYAWPQNEKEVTIFICLTKLLQVIKSLERFEELFKDLQIQSHIQVPIECGYISFS